MNFLNKFTRNEMQKDFHERCIKHVNVIDMFPRRYGKSVAIAMFALASALETKSNVLVYDNEQRYIQFLVTSMYKTTMPEKEFNGSSKITFDNGSTIYFVTECDCDYECSKPDLFLFEYISDNKKLTEELIPKMYSLDVPMKGVCTELWSSRTNPPDTSMFNINCFECTLDFTKTTEELVHDMETMSNMNCWYYRKYEDKNALNKRITNHIMTKQISCN